jgi:hypothetical protein
MIKLDADDFEAVMFALQVAANAASDHRGSRTVRVSEDDFINAGIAARETMKAKSFGEFEIQQSEVHRPFADTDPRTARLMQGTVTAFVSPANDPIDW